jgi:hypothetical protein
MRYHMEIRVLAFLLGLVSGVMVLQPHVIIGEEFEVSKMEILKGC